MNETYGLRYTLSKIEIAGRKRVYMDLIKRPGIYQAKEKLPNIVFAIILKSLISAESHNYNKKQS